MTYNSSANSCSLADEFDYVIEREGKIKRMPLYHQRRFAKLGCSAAAIIAALDLLQILLREIEKNNILVQSCKLYMECEFLLTKLQALSYFTRKVTLPLFNCLETSQKYLFQRLPALYRDLTNGNMHTLDRVSYKHLAVAQTDNDLVKEILYLMCVDAAYRVKIQCGSQLPRASQLNKLTEDKLFGLPTSNLSTEKDFSKLSRLSEVVKFRNYRFQAKSIRNYMILYKSNAL